MPGFHLCLLIVLFTLGEASASASQYELDYRCEMTSCRYHGPVIKFPFRLKDKQPTHCGLPGFDLSCTQNNNETVLDLPFPFKDELVSNKTDALPTSVKLIVDKIDYNSQLVHVSKIDAACLPRLLRNLNFSAYPFSFEYQSSFILFTCLSAKTNIYMDHVPCLGNQVYAVESANMLYTVPLFNCSKLYKVSSINQEVDLGLHWSEPMCRHCELQGKYCGLKRNSPKPGNETQCFDIPPTGPSKKAIIAGAVLGVFALTFVVMGIYQSFNSTKQNKKEQAKIERFLEYYRTFKPTRYSYSDIKKITNQFSQKLGEGGYGSVYKGQLSSNVFVAVKVLQNSKGNGEDFINEVGTIGRIHHINVVRLVGYCADGFTRALVYEFLTNHSLEKFLSPKNHNHHSFSWEKLQQIAQGIAKGIEYLHQGCDQRILHFDIKPHNILLDHTFTPKISDFGLAKLCSKENSIVSMSVARGTIGYIAPEMFSRNFGNVSYKSDVYSFGMLLLEMVGERNNMQANTNRCNEVYFPEYVYKRLDQEEDATFKIRREGDVDIAKKLTIVGLWCIQWYPANRPSMKAVIQMLEGEKIPTVPPNPFGTRDSMKRGVALQGRPSSIELEIISESKFESESE